MTNFINTQDLEFIDPIDISAHIFDLYTSHRPANATNLGYISRKDAQLRIDIGSDIEINISQSLTELASKTETSSTGFVCWQTTPLLADWILNDPRCPFYKIFEHRSSLRVVEVGTGVAGVLAVCLSPRVGHYICTDQSHILKLLGRNIINNVSRFESTTITTEQEEAHTKTTKSRKGRAKSNPSNTCRIDLVEYDWEELDYGYDNLQRVMNPDYSTNKEEIYPDLIIAADTVYNEYLVPYFVQALLRLMDKETGVIISLQLRDETVMECFLEEAGANGLRVYAMPVHVLSDALSRGFMVYYLVRS